MGTVKTRKRVEIGTRGYAQGRGIAATTESWERPRLFDAGGQGVLPGLEEHAVRIRLRCDGPDEAYHFVVVDGMTFVLPLAEVHRLATLYPRVSTRDWELWAARELSREVARAFEAVW